MLCPAGCNGWLLAGIVAALGVCFDDFSPFFMVDLLFVLWFGGCRVGGVV